MSYKEHWETTKWNQENQGVVEIKDAEQQAAQKDMKVQNLLIEVNI